MATVAKLTMYKVVKNARRKYGTRNQFLKDKMRTALFKTCFQLKSSKRKNKSLKLLRMLKLPIGASNSKKGLISARIPSCSDSVDYQFAFEILVKRKSTL